MSALTIALPPLVGIALETCISLNEKLAARGQLQASRIFQITIAFFLVYETVLATLAGTHISPPLSLNCGLRERWQSLYQAKDEGSVRRIQDTFDCCGLTSVKDMAWPFPTADRSANACVERFERDTPCLEPWKAEERKVAILLLVVPVAVFVWMVVIALSPTTQSAWLPSQLSLPSGSSPEVHGQRPRPAIGYRDLEDVGDEDSLHREINNLNKDSHLATHVEGSRARGSGLRNEQDVWRDREDGE